MLTALVPLPLLQQRCGCDIRQEAGPADQTRSPSWGRAVGSGWKQETSPQRCSRWWKSSESLLRAQQNQSSCWRRYVLCSVPKKWSKCLFYPAVVASPLRWRLGEAFWDASIRQLSTSVHVCPSICCDSWLPSLLHWDAVKHGSRVPCAVWIL